MREIARIPVADPCLEVGVRIDLPDLDRPAELCGKNVAEFVGRVPPGCGQLVGGPDVIGTVLQHQRCHIGDVAQVDQGLPAVQRPGQFEHRAFENWADFERQHVIGRLQNSARPAPFRTVTCRTGVPPV